MATPSDAEHLERVRQAATVMASARREVAEAEAALALALEHAHDAGHSWDVLAEAADLESGNAARLRAQRARRGRETEVGIGITAAAEHFGVSRQTIYDWIRDGRLQATTGASGRTRVVLDDNPAPEPD